jgi:hypothetical protein
MRRANVLSLDRARDFRVERPRTRRPNAEVTFTVPAPPDMGNTYQDWRREAVREIKRQGMRSFGGAVRVAVSLPQDRSHGVESCLRAVFDLLSTAGVVQSVNAIEDYRATRGEGARLVITVRAL